MSDWVIGIWLLVWVLTSGHTAEEAMNRCGSLSTEQAVEIVQVVALWPALMVVELGIGAEAWEVECSENK